jgi:acetyltransferase EpsM
MEISIIGGGDHSRIIIDTLFEIYKSNLIIFVYDDNTHYKSYRNSIYKDTIKNIKNIFNPNENFILSISNMNFRKEIFNKMNNLNWFTIIHPKTYISPTAKIGKGVYVGVNSVVNSEAKIEDNCIINTNCVVEHNVNIKNNCVISPSVTISGNVLIKENTFIGCGTTIIDENKNGYIKIGKNCFITAGSLILHSVNDDSKVRGVI